MIIKSDYQRPKALSLFSGHLETIYPAVLRRVKDVSFDRERIGTDDGDFLDLDWHLLDPNKLVIVCHGLEGDSRRPYMMGMAKACGELMGHSVLNWNYRGCSGEMNHQQRFYHSGATDDLASVIAHAQKRGFDEIRLVGFSLGGNLTLKYLGENGDDLPPVIKAAVAFSVPMHLESSCLKLRDKENLLYRKRFLKSLKQKAFAKESLRSTDLPLEQLPKVKDLFHFDDIFTAPLHGFRDAIHYYESCSSLFLLKAIRIPTLIVNARNDPFLSKECYPEDALKDHPNVFLEIPEFGGHCGFVDFGSPYYWSERRAVKFLRDHPESESL